jgi:signal transduction histidine kinase
MPTNKNTSTSVFAETGLADLIEYRRDEIARRLTDRLYRTTVPESVNRSDVVDSLGEFLVDLAARIRDSCRPAGATTPPPPNITAAEHAKQRFGMGYDIGAVVREYAALRDVIWEMAEEIGIPMRAQELSAFSRHLISGIADAASRYAHERDARLRQEAAKHVGFLAHELRNPLGSMRVAFNLLKRKGALAPGRATDIMERSMSRLAERIDNALIEVRLLSGPAIRRERVELPQLLQEIVDESAPEAESRAQRLRLELGEGQLVAHVDQNLLASALTNLVRNAVKFTPDAGTIHVRAKQGDGRLLIEVEDECGGLPPGAVQKLFDPFVQAGKDRSGFGLGLAIAKQAVDAHGGDLRVHSLERRGCVFTLDMPLTHGTAGNDVER